MQTVALVVAATSLVLAAPADLLTEKDLPQRYRAAAENPYRSVLDALRSGTCALPTPATAEQATFVTRDRYALDVESLTEHLATPGAATARRLVATTAALPRRCATFETPRYTVHVKPQPMPRIGDASTALRVVFWVKAAGSQTTYVDVMEAEVATVARGGHHVTVILLGYYAKHAADLTAVTRTAVRRAA